MRARNKIYHTDCFRCIVCSKLLVAGDEYSLRENGLICRADNEIVEQAALGERITTPVPLGAGQVYENNNKPLTTNNNNSDTKAFTSRE